MRKPLEISDKINVNIFKLLFQICYQWLVVQRKLRGHASGVYSLCVLLNDGIDTWNNIIQYVKKGLMN